MGIDSSTRCGVAVLDFGKNLLHASQIEFPKMEGFERAGNIAQAVLDITHKFKPDLIVMEDYAPGKFAGAIIPVVEIGTLIQFSHYMEDDEPILKVSPTSMKKFVVGAGNAKKEQVMMFVYKRWGITPSTNNIGDAIGLAMMGLCALGEPFPKENVKSIQTILKGFAPKATVQLIAS